MLKEQPLMGKRTLVTGGGTGLGREMASMSLGADLYLCGRRKDVVGSAQPPSSPRSSAAGVDWLTSNIITIDGGNSLATGGNFYAYRNHTDEDWIRIRETIRAQDSNDKAQRAAA
jgi:hypothetical protein